MQLHTLCLGTPSSSYTILQLCLFYAVLWLSLAGCAIARYSEVPYQYVKISTDSMVI